MRVFAAGGGHLQLLHVADAVGRVKDGAGCSRHVLEAFECRLARVAAGRDENRHFAVFAVLLGGERRQVRQQLQRQPQPGSYDEKSS